MSSWDIYITPSSTLQLQLGTDSWLSHPQVSFLCARGLSPELLHYKMQNKVCGRWHNVYSNYHYCYHPIRINLSTVSRNKGLRVSNLGKTHLNVGGAKDEPRCRNLGRTSWWGGWLLNSKRTAFISSTSNLPFTGAYNKTAIVSHWA